MSKKLLFKGGHRTGMTPYEIEDFLSLYMRDARVDEKTKAYIDSIIGNTVLNLCPYRNVLVTHKYDTVEGNAITLDDCQDDEIIQLSEIQGNTMVNCNKDTDKELILMPNLDTNGYSNVTLTEGIDGGKVDVSLEGNTMVNVCEQEDPIAITKSYTVETGNHIALQGEYDGKCRPNIYGNTLVNLNTDTIYATNENFIDYILTYEPKNNILYTIIIDISYVTTDVNKPPWCGFLISTRADWVLPPANIVNGLNTIKITVKGEDISKYFRVGWNENCVSNIVINKLLILEGDYTNKPIPDYFTGMKSSFEDKLIPENLYKFSSRDDFYLLDTNATLDGEYIKMIANGKYQNVMLKPLDTIKPSTTYTIVANVVENTLDSRLIITVNDKKVQLFTAQKFQIDAGKTGIFTQVVTTGNDLSGCTRCLVNYLEETNTTGSIKYRIMVVEGDYTNYDFTDYDSTKGGKYKVDYKVTGKNKFNGDVLTNISINTQGVFDSQANAQCTDYTQVQGNTSYTISNIPSYADRTGLLEYDNNKKFVKFTSLTSSNKTFTTTSNTKYIVYYYYTGTDGEKEIPTNLQLEEGTTATTYEPYKESIKTLYLNSPLLEGDTIEQSGNNIIHVHRYKEVVLDGSLFTEVDTDINGIHRYYSNNYQCSNYVLENSCYCDKLPISISCEIDGCITFSGSGFIEYATTKSMSEAQEYLQQNPITVVYLATPTQEIISPNDNLLLDSYTNGHLDVDSVVPIDKVRFGNVGIPLKYVYANTEYTFQFESDNIGKVDIYNGSGFLENINVTKGLNKLTITSDSNGFNGTNWSGIGFNASKIVVTPKVDNNFGYFKGMKSVGECEDNKIEILSNNINLFNGEWELGGFKTNGSPSTDTNQFRCVNPIKVEPNTRYSHSSRKVIHYLDKDLNQITYDVSGALIFDTPSNCHYINIRTFNADFVSDFKNFKYMLVKGENMPTTHIDGLSNKKEILLSEPLRGLPNGVKDKYVLIDGKWYIERNCGKKVEPFICNDSWDEPKILEPKGIKLFKIAGGIESFTVVGYFRNAISNKFRCTTYDYIDSKFNSPYLAYITTDGNLWVSASRNTTVEQMLSYIKDCEFIYQLPSPTYEPIDYNPLEVYTDTTHISNNSTIPCNMVIKNSGYNCILKPNTTYTVSSNNGLSTVTTKDSIGDSILRFYNKDTSKITKMNKVLALEGDYVTGNPPIPSFFKGMESTFEQELVTDENDKNFGKYKVEVLANNENLFPNNVNILENKVWDSSNGSIVVVSGYNCIDKMIKVLPNIDYSLSCNGKHCQGNIWFYDENKKGISQVYTSPFTTPPNTRYISYHASSSSCQVGAKLMLNLTTIIKDYIPHEENNITFYINEPLRGVGNVKDKVYVKEDKAVVERNCASVTFDGSDDEKWSPTGFGGHATRNTFEIALANINGYTRLTPSISNSFNNEIIEGLPLNDNAFRVVTEVTGNSYFLFTPSTDRIPYRDVDKWKKYLQQNPITVVYQLATPVYEEVECDLSKLALEGYNHGTLFYNSNIPVTTQFYDFKVNIKDMLIPNETYYITFIADRVKDITINLSGVQVNYKTSMGYNKVPVQLGDVVNTNFSMDSRGVELSDLMISTSTSLIYVKDMNDVCIYDEASNKYSVTITSTGGNESDKRVILLDYPLLRLNKDIYDRLYYNNKDSRYRIDKKVFKHKFTNDREYSKYAAETNDTYYSSFISLNESIKDYVVITSEKVKTVKVEDDKYYFKIKWSDLGVSDKTEANGNQGMKDFFNNNEVYLYYATDGFVEMIDGLKRQTLKVYQPETTMNFLGNTTTTVTIVIPKKNI